ncbi:MAG: hypothetical protein OXF56_24770 [Rhodobacteraceae bacterium]|nr:hypothetical protein [Paracoccaceae bacterium]
MRILIRDALKALHLELAEERTTPVAKKSRFPLEAGREDCYKDLAYGSCGNLLQIVGVGALFSKQLRGATLFLATRIDLLMTPPLRLSP